jgi:multidrug transporter EmrE-like cation transporter
MEEASVARPRAVRIPVRSLAVLSLVLLFIAGGLTDVSMKTFDEVFVGLHSRWQFMAFVFGTAALTGLTAMGLTGRFSRKILSRRLLLLALILGVVNVASVQFLLQAIEVLSGTFVFPVLNISVVVGGALMGVLIWHERLSRLNRWGIALAVVALVLMQI